MSFKKNVEREFRNNARRPQHDSAKPEPQGSADWRTALRRRGDRITGDVGNIILAMNLAPELRGCLRFNTFGNLTEAAKALPWREPGADPAWTDCDDVRLRQWFEERDIAPQSPGVVGAAVETLSREFPCHPVRDYLAGLRWDGKARLDHWLKTYVGATGPQPYLETVGSKALIAAVARVMKPGCQADHVLVLEGPQGIGKTSVIRELGGVWTTDSISELSGADAAIQLAGVWLVELPELAALRRSDLESMKAFLTRTVDRYRPPYGKRSVDVPRQCVFFGSTNEGQYLRDRTGNRRFWPVSCTRIDLDALRRDRDQIWAEALHRYEAGEGWHLGSNDARLAAAEQSRREMVSELEEAVSRYLEQLTESETTVREVLVFGLGLDPEKTDYTERAVRLGAQVAEALRHNGWVYLGRRGHGDSRRTVYRRNSLEK